MYLKFIQSCWKKKSSPGLQSDKRLGWKNAVLDLSSILFIKSELHCRRFAPLWNSEITWSKARSFISLTSLWQLFFNPTRIFAVDINRYTNFYQLDVLMRLHFVLIRIFGGMNGKLLQRIYFPKNAKKTCKPINRDLNDDWTINLNGN